MKSLEVDELADHVLLVAEGGSELEPVIRFVNHPRVETVVANAL